MKVRKTTKPRSRLGRLAAGFLASILVLIGLEAVARIVTFSWADTSLGWAVPTPVDASRCSGPIELAGDLAPKIDEIWACPPDHPYRVISNNMGLRRRTPTTLAPPPGVTRIYCLGDSFTFGTGVANDETWPALLEASLNTRPASAKVEVLNAGIGGYGLEQELSLFTSRGTRCDPDLLILQVLFNDVSGYHPTIRGIFQRNRTGIADGTILEGLVKQVRRFHRNHPRASALLDFLYRMKQPASPELLLRLARGEKDSVRVEGRTLDAGTAALVRHSWSIWTDPRHAEQLRSYQQENERDFTTLVDSVRSRGIPLLVVYFPTQTSLGLRQRGGDPAESYYRDLTGRHQIPFLDLSDAFDEKGETRTLFLWPWDMHCSYHGNDLAARRIEAAIVKQPLAKKLAGGGPGS